jgi:hypothetical protein
LGVRGSVGKNVEKGEKKEEKKGKNERKKTRKEKKKRKRKRVKKSEKRERKEKKTENEKKKRVVVGIDPGSVHVNQPFYQLRQSLSCSKAAWKVIYNLEPPECALANECLKKSRSVDKLGWLGDSDCAP